MKSISIILLSLLILACSENKAVLTQNEKNYLATRDSLIKYKSGILKISDGDSLQQSVADYIKLDYNRYKAKYHLSEKEMDATRKAFNATCEIVKTIKEVEKNIPHSKLNQYHSKSKDSIKGNYSFNKNLKPATSAKKKMWK